MRHRRLIPAFVALLGISLSLISMLSIRYSERFRLESEFSRRANLIAHSLEEGLREYHSTIEPLQNFAHIGTSGAAGPEGPMEVDIFQDREMWQWARLLFRQRFEDALQSHPALVAQGWIVQSRHAELPFFKLLARSTLGREYQVTEINDSGEIVPAGVREDYFPMFFYEPLGEGEFLGFDHGAYPLTRTALERSRDEGITTSTEPLTWFENLLGSPGIYIYGPVYESRQTPPTIEERRGDVVVYVFSLVNVEELLRDSIHLDETEGIDYRLFTEVTGGFGQAGIQVGPYTLSKSEGFEEKDRSLFDLTSLSLIRQLDLADQNWTLECYPNAELTESFQTMLPFAVLVVGLFITLGLTIYLTDTANYAARVERLIDERTEALAASNEELREEIVHRQKAESEKRELESRLIQKQKLEAVGTLAGGVAHDFNNLLTGIMGYAELLRDGVIKGDKTQEAASVIMTAAERAKELTSQLLGFARKGKHQNIALDLHAIINEVVKLLGRTLGKHIEVERRYDAGDVLVKGDPHQMQQVILNLAVNAHDAMPDGGTLTIQTRQVLVDEDLSRQHADATPGEYVCISVSDTGTGIPEEIHQRIFEPFFTTKEQGKGTGMGLAMVYGIVQNHGGFVSLESTPGRGSTFHLYLPVAEDSSPETRIQRNLSDISEGRGTILMVDDEAIVLDVAASLLEQLGYEVIPFQDGADAVRFCESEPKSIDLAIIDMIMPGMDGRECFEALRSVRPDLNAVLSTGYSRDGSAQELLNLEGMVGFIQKPYKLDQLAEVVSNAINASTAAS